MNNENGSAPRSAGLDDDAEWRPFQVWESQFKTEDGRPVATLRRPLKSRSPQRSAESAKDWDPFTVWQRQVQGN